LVYSFYQNQIDGIEEVLQKDLINKGVYCVLFIDMAGSIIAKLDNGKVDYEVYSLAALAAANFGAVNAMANMIGEEEFSLLFHKGDKENIYFNKVTEDFLLITIFGPEVSLGLIRLKTNELIEKLEKIIESPST